MYGIHTEIFDMKEIKEDQNKWRDKPSSWVRRLSVVKMSILSKFLLEIPESWFFFLNLIGG